MTRPTYRNDRARCGSRACVAGTIDAEAIQPGDAIRCIGRTWWTVLDNRPTSIPGTRLIVLDDPTSTRPWGAEASDWCRCQHRTREDPLDAQEANHGSVQLDLFGTAA